MEILARINALHNELARAHFEGADFAAVRLCIVASALHARLGIERAIRRWAWQYRAIWLAIRSERLLLAIVDAEERGDVAAVQEFLAAKYAADHERFNLKKYGQTRKEGTAEKWAK